MASSQRRLPSGRFAKVTQLPDVKPRKKRGPEGRTGVIIVSTNAAIRKADVAELRRRVPADLLSDAETRATRIQERIRTAMLAEYSRSGTGRAARGIFAKVSSSQEGDKANTVIQITALNYREMRFLTNIGGTGYFKAGYPVGPYQIFAKGAREELEDINSETGEARIVKTKARIRAARSESGVKRLKVPRRGRFFVATPTGRSGTERRDISDILGPRRPDEALGAFFFYPLWVNHPGFRRDIPAEIALEEGAKYITETQQVVRLAYSETDPDRVLGVKGVLKSSDLAVSAEIPIPSLTLTRAGFRRDPYSTGTYQVDSSGRRIK